MKRIKKFKKKTWAFLAVITYLTAGGILSICVGCSSMQQTLDLEAPLYVNDQAYNIHADENRKAGVSLRLFYGGGHAEFRNINIENGDWERVKQFGTSMNPVPFIQIKANSKICEKLMNSPSELKDFWENNRQAIYTKERTKARKNGMRTMGSDGRAVWKNITINQVPSYSNEADFPSYFYVSCNEFETAAIPWKKLPDNSIIAIIKCTDNEKYRYTQLFIKRHKGKEWLSHNLGTPSSSTGRFCSKCCNALLWPITLPCALIRDLITSSVGIPQ